jgi:hypothetical protein
VVRDASSALFTISYVIDSIKETLILRKLQSGFLEARTTPIQPIFVFFTRSKAGTYPGRGHRPSPV